MKAKVVRAVRKAKEKAKKKVKWKGGYTALPEERDGTAVPDQRAAQQITRRRSWRVDQENTVDGEVDLPASRGGPDAVSGEAVDERGWVNTGTGRRGTVYYAAL